MTVGTSYSAITFQGNGSTTIFTFGFIGVTAADLNVYYTANNGTVTLLSPSVYTLNLNTPATGQIWGVGGTITYPISGTPIQSGSSLTIERMVPLTQPITISNQSNFYPVVVETAIDNVELQLQDVQTQADFAIQTPITDGVPQAPLPSAVNRENTILGFDGTGQLTLFPINIPTLVPTDGVMSFPTFAIAQTASLSLVNYIYIQGYSASGDGGEAYWKKVPSVPYHSVYFTSADGGIWVPAQSRFDPRAFGAKADVFCFSFGTVLNSNLSQLIVNDSNFPGFTVADIGKNIVLWDFPYAHTLVNTTIASIAGLTTVNLTAPASGPTTGNSDGFYGSDDTAIINTVLSLGQYQTSGFNVGPPPTGAYHSSAFNSLSGGGHTIIFRALDRNTSRYGISGELNPSNSCVMECEENAFIWALGSFAATTAMIYPRPNNSNMYVILDNLKLYGNGFAQIGFNSGELIYSAIKNGIWVHSCYQNGLIFGNSGIPGSTFSMEGRIHLEGPSSSMSGFNNNASSIGLWIQFCADSKCSGTLEIINYRTGIRVDSGDIDFTGQTHVWTNTNGGYLTTGAVVNSSDINFSKLTIDSPWAGVSTPCYGLVINGNSCNVNHLTCELNVGTTGVLDNTVVAVRYIQANASQVGVELTGRLGSRIDSIWTSSSNSSVKLAQVVDASLASNILLDVGSINTDGNVYDIGWYTQTERTLLSLSTTVASLSDCLSSQAVQTANWTPAQLRGNVIYWMDASNTAYYDVDLNGNLRSWSSRGSKGRAIQSGVAARPTFNTSGWTGTGVTTQTGITFNGSTQYMFFDDITSGRTDIRIFAAIIPKTTGSVGPILTFNNPPNFGGLLRQAASGTFYSATDSSATGSHGTSVTASVPTLLTGIWSSTSTEATGSYTRVYQANAGGTNSTPNSLIAGGGPVTMGGLIGSNTLSQTISFVLAELIVVKGVFPNGSELAKEQVIEGYLAWKWWGTTGGHSTVLTSGHPYYTAAPQVSAFTL